MEKIEASGRTLEEALQVAAQELNVGVDGVEYEIVEEGAKGFLGLGGALTVVQAWVREGYEAAEGVPAESISAESIPTEGILAESAPSAVPEQKPLSGQAADFRDAVMRIVADVIKAMELDATAVVKSADEEEIDVEILGKDVAILIGKHGQTLDALQYLIGIAASRGSEGKIRVVLDAEGYRQRHIMMLEKTAREYAKAVKEAGQEAVLEPQSARDRRVIHMALADDPDVYTYSEGEGENRHVVISPKK